MQSLIDAWRNALITWSWPWQWRTLDGAPDPRPYFDAERDVYRSPMGRRCVYLRVLGLEASFVY